MNNRALFLAIISLIISFFSQTMEPVYGHIAFVGNEHIMTKTHLSKRDRLKVDTFSIFSISNLQELYNDGNVSDSIVLDQKKERIVIFSSTGNYVSQSLLCDLKTKASIVLSKNEIPLLKNVSFLSDKDTLRIYFDESNPTSLLIQVNPDNKIVSYNYITKASHDIGIINALCYERCLLKSQYIFDAVSHIPWIIFQHIDRSNKSNTITICTFVAESDRADMPLIHNVKCNKGTINSKIEWCDSYCDFISDKTRTFVCINPHFNQQPIADDIHNISREQLLELSARNGGCYIWNVKTDKCVHLCDEEDRLVLFYAMKLHPNNKVIAGIPVYDGLLRYWSLDRGSLLAIQEDFTPYGSMDMNWCKDYGKNQFDISPNGQRVAVINKNSYSFLDVPFEARFGLSKWHLSFIWWFLNNNDINKTRKFPKDITRIIFNMLVHI